MAGEKAVEFGAWTILVDVAATRAAYSQIAKVWADLCGCENCENFVLLRDEVYPPEVLALFREVGVDYRKEDEAYRMARIASGAHLYGGHFYVCGTIESYSGAKEPADFFRASDSFGIKFLSVHPGAPDSFQGRPCIEAYFYAHLPWRLDGPEPD